MSVDEALAPTDAACQRFLDAIRAELGDKVVEATIQRNDVIVRVHRDAWVAAVTACRTVGANHFCFLSGLDWLVNPTQTTRYENVWGSVAEEAGSADADADGGDEITTEAPPASAAPVVARVTGLAGGDTRFQVFARFTSLTEHRGIVLKADLDEADPRVATISTVFAGANWHERETWEMFGFWFDGHPNLIHIYLPGAFEGYPLRKDFPLLAREVKPWPGLTNVEPIAGEADAEEADA